MSSLEQRLADTTPSVIFDIFPFDFNTEEFLATVAGYDPNIILLTGDGKDFYDIDDSDIGSSIAGMGQ